METTRHPQPSTEASETALFSRSQRVIHVRAPKPAIHQEQVQRVTRSDQRPLFLTPHCASSAC